MANPLYMDSGPTSMQALIDSLQGRRRYPIDDPVSGYQPATDPDAKPPPYAPPQFMAPPRPRRTPQDIIDEAARAKAAFQPVKPNIPEQIGDIASKTAQTIGQPIIKAKELTERALGGEFVSNDPEAVRGAADVALATLGGGALGAQRGALGAAGGRLVVPQAARAAGETGPFYSAVEQALANAKLEKAPLDQWHNYLKGQPGVKAEELQQLGIVPGDVTKSGSMSKAQLQEHLDANRVQLKEVTKGGPTYADKEQHLRSEFERQNPKPEQRPALSDWKAQRDTYVDEQIKQNPPGGLPKFESYQLPGAANYGETLLTLPPSEPYHVALKNYGDAHGIINLGEAEKAFQKATGRTPMTNVEYRSSHWDEPNVLAHVRHNDRFIPSEQGSHSRFDPATAMIEETDPPPTRQNGYNSLHLEEVQSDMHQAGRKQGYQSEYDESLKNVKEAEQKANAAAGNIKDEASSKTWQDLNKAYNGLVQAHGEKFGGRQPVPDAPFKDTWSDLALKRMLHKAATETNPDGSFKYHAMSWTPGEAQAARYDLSKKLDKVQYSPSDGGRGRLVGIKNGEVVVNKGDVPPEKLADHVGKDVAEKLLSTDPEAIPFSDRQRTGKSIWSSNLNGVHELEGEGLKMSHKGMQDFYDKMLVDKANALGKRYGTRVGRSPIMTDAREGMRGELNRMIEEDGGQPIEAKHEKATHLHVLPITPELRAAAAKGFPLFALGAAAGPALTSQREPAPLGNAAAKALATKPPDVGL